ncbi:MAG: tol-pal system protein YbgF [Parvularculales bacterium]
MEIRAQTELQQPRWIDDQFQSLQQQQTQQPPLTTGTSLNDSFISQESRVVADTVARIEEYERALRELTGQLEELRNLANLTAADRVRRENDTDLRLQDLEEAIRDIRVQLSTVSSSGAAAYQGDQKSVEISDDLVTGTEDVSDVGTDPRALGFVSQSALLSGVPTTDYEEALKLLRQRNVDRAQEMLQTFLVQYPNDNLTGNAFYWLGETYYVQGDYQKAADNFQSGFEHNNRGNKAPDNLLKRAMSLARLGQVSEACQTFERLQIQYPEADLSIQQRANLESRQNKC